MRIENLTQVLKKIDGLGKKCELIPGWFADLVRGRAYELAPRKTGRLRKSIGVRRTRRGYEVVMGGSEAPYAGYVEYGVRPHLIRARRARALRFEVKGEVVYARYVMHPGSRPRAVMSRALSEASKDFGRMLSELLS